MRLDPDNTGIIGRDRNEKHMGSSATGHETTKDFMVVCGCGIFSGFLSKKSGYIMLYPLFDSDRKKNCPGGAD